MNKAIPIAVVAAAGVAIWGLVVDANKPTPAEELAKLREPGQVCTSDSAACKQWTEWMLGCMKETTRTCAAAEELRERASGVELSTDPNAYQF